MSNRGRLGGLNWVPMGSEILGKNLVDKRLKELNVRRRIAFKRHTARAYGVIVVINRESSDLPFSWRLLGQTRAIRLALVDAADLHICGERTG